MEADGYASPKPGGRAERTRTEIDRVRESITSRFSLLQQEKA